MERADILVGSILSVCRARDDWMASGAPRLTNSCAEAMDEMIAVWDDGDIPGECRPLFEVYPRIKAEWQAFGEYMSEREPSPKQSFWNVLAQMESILQASPDDWEAPPLESVRQLVEEKVSYRQICVIYSHEGEGPFMRRGQPQPHLAAQQYKFEMGELDPRTKQPYAAVLPDDFVHPASTARKSKAKRVEKRLAERAARLQGNGFADSAPQEEFQEELNTGESPEAPPEPGSPEEKVKQAADAHLTKEILRLHKMSPNVSSRDIAETLGCKVKEVNDAIRKGGI